MLTALIIIHSIVCVLLVAVVLLQFGKGAEAGAMMGQGSSQAIFTSSQRGNIFTKITAVLAILFMANSIIISTMTSRKSSESIFDDAAIPVTKSLSTEAVQKEVPKAVPAQKKASKK